MYAEDENNIELVLSLILLKWVEKKLGFEIWMIYATEGSSRDAKKGLWLGLERTEMV